MKSPVLPAVEYVTFHDLSCTYPVVDRAKCPVYILRFVQ